MTTYHRLLLLTTLGSALLTFCVLQASGINASSNKHNQPQQLQSTPQSQATEYYTAGQPRLITLTWQPPCAANTCEPGLSKIPVRQQTDMGI
ncbi:MAG: hypothetical protein RQ732_02190 [Methylophaga sp.]|nr:hypothetical protein [Methylophaga sp.]